MLARIFNKKDGVLYVLTNFIAIISVFKAADNNITLTVSTDAPADDDTLIQRFIKDYESTDKMPVEDVKTVFREYGKSKEVKIIENLLDEVL